MKNNFIVELTETTKAFPKKSYYVCEYGAILNETKIKENATKFDYRPAAENIVEFVNETFDYSAKVVPF